MTYKKLVENKMIEIKIIINVFETCLITQNGKQILKGSHAFGNKDVGFSGMGVSGFLNKQLTEQVDEINQYINDVLATGRTYVRFWIKGKYTFSSYNGKTQMAVFVDDIKIVEEEETNGK